MSKKDGTMATRDLGGAGSRVDDVRLCRAQPTRQIDSLSGSCFPEQNGAGSGSYAVTIVGLAYLL